MTSALIIFTGSKVWTTKDGTPHPTSFWVREFMEETPAWFDTSLVSHNDSVKVGRENARPLFRSDRDA